MNSVVKETLNYMQKCDSFHERCDCLLDHSECDYLLDYINQLETNRDEAIEYLKYALDEEKETSSKHNDWRLDLLEILEGGSNE